MHLFKKLEHKQVNSISGKIPSRLFVRCANTNIYFLIDTGAEVSIFSHKTSRSFQKNCEELFAANGTRIATFGSRTLDLNLGLRRKFKWKFIIADTNRSILGAGFLRHYGLSVHLKTRESVDENTKTRRVANISTAHFERISTIGKESEFAELLEEFIDITKPMPRVEIKNPQGSHHIKSKKTFT